MAPPTATTKKWINKKTATHFQVRYRSQNDPLIHDESATDFVLQHVDAPNSNKVKTAHDLEQELGLPADGIRKNEGEAAMYGIYYDDTSYDYMQHLRDIGSSSEAVFIEAPDPFARNKARKSTQHAEKQKQRQKQSLDEAIREAAPPPEELIPPELRPSEKEIKRSYQDQQDVPDALSGFQPDMDPRLREVLEALEDEAYVDDDEDVFGELTKGGEAEEEEFLNMEFVEEEEDGWDSDATERPTPREPAPSLPSTEPSTAVPDVSAEAEPSGAEPSGAAQEPSEDWREFTKWKKQQKRKPKKPADDDYDDVNSSVAGSGAETMSFGGSMSIGGTMSVSGRRRRRREKKGTTISTGYSMSSSALFRTDAQTLLDQRFDKIEEAYNSDNDSNEDEDGGREGGINVDANGVPVVREETRKDLNSILDNFLENYSTVGKKPRVRRGKHQDGLQQLDEIRRGLGNTRLR